MRSTKFHRVSSLVLAACAAAAVAFEASPARADEPAPAPVAAATCALGEHPGIDEADAKTAGDVVCHDLAAKNPSGAFEVKLGKLGGKILLSVRSGAAERRVLLQGIDEITVASPRLAEAIAEGKPVDDTQTVNNVLRDEARTPVSKPGRMGFNGGIFGVAPVGLSATPSPGVDLGLLYNAERLGVAAQLRMAPSGTSGSTSLSYVVLGTGARYYFSDQDFAPYAGAGVGLSHLCVARKAGSNECGTGFGGYVEAGAEGLRTHRVGVTAGLRADIPFYKMARDYSDHWSYSVPVSLMVGMRFH